MPLRALVPSLWRIQSDPSSSSSFRSNSHPLHDLLRPLLLTPRSASQKYHTRLNQMIEEDTSAGDDEEQMMWLAYRNAKGDAELVEQTQDASGTVSMFDAEEAWKDRWLAKMEQRDDERVQIQIILHFFLLSLPGAPSQPPEEPQPELPAYLSPSKKRKRKHKVATPPPQGPTLEECIELFMDKLSMWQLMSALDAQDAQRDRGNPHAKGKQKAADERDWMQAFCEDTVEPRFKTKLPDLCKLLRSKVFQDSSFTDDPDDLLSSPPVSPRPAAKRLKTSAASSQHTSFSRTQPRTKDAQPDPRELQRARSRSLTVTLEQERARSRSISTGPGNALRKRAIVREVSMTTAFKSKAQAKAREKEQATAKARVAAQKEKARTLTDAGAAKALARTKSSVKGVTLVEATPVKPKERSDRGASETEEHGEMEAGEGAAPLPRCELGNIVEGDEDEDEWTLPSSPDILLLGSGSGSGSHLTKASSRVSDDDDDDDDDVLGWMARNTHLVTDTPTKPKRTKH
ncbi:hypothetical protein EVJ58_g477 [Rhodofomes roseus]|uniref:DNA replication regulator Sld3 C-terminal domain-containing protein n=1 Tax=Rhodofomes roseus TaxID=34475 RepID=A0A4Y9Z652_9APHY|nr:hypothetical protein EVJ58_g477 [Rhodofomes roseus]